MNTRERLEKFHAMVKQGAGTEELSLFVEANKGDKRFTSLVDLRRAFLTAFKAELMDQIEDSREDQELIEHEMQEHTLEVMNFAAESAKKRARRIAAVV
jgi:hypothetical protein